MNPSSAKLQALVKQEETLSRLHRGWQEQQQQQQQQQQQLPQRQPVLINPAQIIGTYTLQPDGVAQWNQPFAALLPQASPARQPHVEGARGGTQAAPNASPQPTLLEMKQVCLPVAACGVSRFVKWRVTCDV